MGANACIWEAESPKRSVGESITEERDREGQITAVVYFCFVLHEKKVDRKESGIDLGSRVLHLKEQCLRLTAI